MSKFSLTISGTSISLSLALLLQSASTLAAPISQRFFHSPATMALLFHTLLVGAPGSEEEGKVEPKSGMPKKPDEQNEGGGGGGGDRGEDLGSGYVWDDEDAYGRKGAYALQGGGIAQDRIGRRFVVLPTTIVVEGVRHLGPLADFEGIYSGVLTSCVAYILLWDFDATQRRYGHIRGYHLGGGASGLALPPTNGSALTSDSEMMALSLFHGVPNEDTTVMIAVGGGALDQIQ